MSTNNAVEVGVLHFLESSRVHQSCTVKSPTESYQKTKKKKKNHQLRKSKRRNKKIKKINKQKQLRTRDNGLVGTGLTEG